MPGWGSLAYRRRICTGPSRSRCTGSLPHPHRRRSWRRSSRRHCRSGSHQPRQRCLHGDGGDVLRSLPGGQASQQDTAGLGKLKLIVTEWILLVLIWIKCRCTILCFHCSTCFASDCRQQAQHKSESPNHKQMKTKFILNLIKLWRLAHTESTDLYLESRINISVCIYLFINIIST